MNNEDINLSKLMGKYLESGVLGFWGFGVWIFGNYDFTINGLLLCYTLALPFFAHSLISTFIFSSLIEGILKINFIKTLKLNIN